MTRDNTFETVYRKYPFAPLVDLGIGLALTLSGLVSNRPRVRRDNHTPAAGPRLEQAV